MWWDGRVVGGWSQRPDGEIAFGLLEDIGADGVRAIEAEAQRLAAWLGDVRFSPSFLPPFQRALHADGLEPPGVVVAAAKPTLSGVCPARRAGIKPRDSASAESRLASRHQPYPRKISFAITSRWICEVPS